MVGLRVLKFISNVDTTSNKRFGAYLVDATCITNSKSRIGTEEWAN